MEHENKNTTEHSQNKEVLNELSEQVAYALDQAQEYGVSIVPRSEQDEQSTEDVLAELTHQRREATGQKGINYALNTYKGLSSRPTGDDYTFSSLAETGVGSGVAVFTIREGEGTFEHIDRKTKEAAALPVQGGDIVVVSTIDGDSKERDAWQRVVSSNPDAVLQYDFSMESPRIHDYHDITNSSAGRRFEERRADAEQKKTVKFYDRARRKAGRKVLDILK